MRADNTGKTDVLVCGGGIVGVGCALTLARRGFRTTLIERGEPQASAVSASCGWIAPGGVMPLSRPGVLRKVPGWLADPLGPLSVQWSALVEIFPWFLRFLRHATAAQLEKNVAGLAALNRAARDDYEKLLRPLELTHFIGDAPVLFLHEDAAAFNAARRDAEQYQQRHGFETETLSREQLREQEPALSPIFFGALSYRDWRHITDPPAFIAALTDAFCAAGGETVRGEVRRINKEKGKISEILLADGNTIRAEHYVLAAGAWTKPLAAQIGEKLPIIGVAGYQATNPTPAKTLRHGGISWVKNGFGVTPRGDGISVAGSISFTRLGSAPDFRRAQILIEKTKKLLPGISDNFGKPRFGLRPLCPDSLPIIDRAPSCRNAYIASGHGQLGLTLAATTGRLIADIIAGDKSHIPLSPYRAERFRTYGGA